MRRPKHASGMHAPAPCFRRTLAVCVQRARPLHSHVHAIHTYMAMNACMLALHAERAAALGPTPAAGVGAHVVAVGGVAPLPGAGPDMCEDDDAYHAARALQPASEQERQQQPPTSATQPPHSSTQDVWERFKARRRAMLARRATVVPAAPSRPTQGPPPPEPSLRVSPATLKCREILPQWNGAWGNGGWAGLPMVVRRRFAAAAKSNRARLVALADWLHDRAAPVDRLNWGDIKELKGRCWFCGAQHSPQFW